MLISAMLHRDMDYPCLGNSGLFTEAPSKNSGKPMRSVKEMEIFLEVVRQGSFSAAARRLGIAPSVVADRVSGLEKRLGVRLLTRTTRRQAITEAGATYFEEASAILASIATMEQRVTEVAALPRGMLKVTAPMPIGRQWIAPFIAEFVERYPDIRVHLTLDDRFADIVGEGFDLAIRGGPAVDSALAGRRLFQMRRVVVASPAYLDRNGAPSRPQDLGSHPCLVFSTSQHFHAGWRFGRGEEARVMRVTGVLASNSSELPVVWALAGLGLAQKSWWEVAGHIQAGRLVTVLDAFEPDPATFFAIHPVGRAQSRKVALFVDELAAALKDI
jgi:LysR family transcriptional regulator, transcriptional activator for dmlA